MTAFLHILSFFLRFSPLTISAMLSPLFLPFFAICRSACFQGILGVLTVTAMLCQPHRKKGGGGAAWSIHGLLPRGLPGESALTIAKGDPVPHSRGRAAFLYPPWRKIHQVHPPKSTTTIRIQYRPSKAVSTAAGALTANLPAKLHTSAMGIAFDFSPASSPGSASRRRTSHSCPRR